MYCIYNNYSMCVWINWCIILKILFRLLYTVNVNIHTFKFNKINFNFKLSSFIYIHHLITVSCDRWYCTCDLSFCVWNYCYSLIRIWYWYFEFKVAAVHYIIDKSAVIDEISDSCRQSNRGRSRSNGGRTISLTMKYYIHTYK